MHSNILTKTQKLSSFVLSAFTYASVLLLSSCGKNDNKQTELVSEFKKGLVSKQIGTTNYYISVPTTYRIKEVEGPDFSVYYFVPKDTTSTPEFSGGLYFGNFPSEFGPHGDNCKSERKQGKILGETANWKVYNCKNLSTIQTIVDSRSGEGWNAKIHAFGNTANPINLNKILEMYSTLSKK